MKKLIACFVTMSIFSAVFAQSAASSVKNCAGILAAASPNTFVESQSSNQRFFEIIQKRMNSMQYPEQNFTLVSGISKDENFNKQYPDEAQAQSQLSALAQQVYPEVNKFLGQKLIYPKVLVVLGNVSDNPYNGNITPISYRGLPVVEVYNPKFSS